MARRNRLATDPIGPRCLLLVVLCCATVLVPATAPARTAPATTRPAGEPKLQVRIDPRVELCTIIFRIAGFNEYTQGRIQVYLDDVDARFQPHANHPVIALARKLRAERGISFDACMALAIHLEPGFDIRPAADLENESLQLYSDGRWTPEHATAFVEAARDFAEQSDFEGFYRAHADLYELTEQRLQALVDEHMHVDWFSQFYGVAPEAPFTIIPSMVNGPANYGPKFVAPDGDEHLYAILGCWQMDDEGLPTFNEDVLGTVVHEFNHSFVNHVVEAHRDELAGAGELIQEAVGGPMTRQAYGHWMTIINESVVRAAVVRYLRVFAGEDAAAREIEAQEGRSFLWIAPLERSLGEYEARRDAFPTFADYMPRIVALLDEEAPKLAAVIERRERELDAKRPRIVSITPVPGSVDVDPSVIKIIIRFDRPMAGGYQCMTSERGMYPPSPDGQGVNWNADRTVFTIPVRLRPGTTYALTLNTESGGAFQSAADHVPLTMTEIWFSTSGS